MSIILQPHVEERLRNDEMAWLITVRPDGRPHSVPVWFLRDGATILVWSKPNTQKIRNLRHNPSVTLALDDTKKGSDVVILEGTAEVLGQAEGREALQVYGKKYSEGLQRIGVPVEAFITLYSQLIRITPAHVLMG